ncbi:uncharacterized protein LOC142985790 [Anticarsia gemmatalis]|uniref:uncharacterized protein LOC142985790 n=1 Tax=Anticarsia gemmatalis TaxID=129554 RepID=UPI003F758505
MAMSTQLIANELLAFIQNAIDTMDEVSVMQICKSNFKEEDISSGKRLLYQSLGKLDQMPSRRRDGTEKSVQDIIALLKVMDPDDVPTFVAKELHKLPPVTFDHVDVTRLLKDITFLKSSLAEMQSMLEVSNNTIGELREELAQLRGAVSSCKSPDTSNVNTRRGAQNASVGNLEAASPKSSLAAETACVAPRPAARPVPPTTSVEVVTRAATSTPTRAYAAVAANQPAGQPPQWRQKGDKKITMRSDVNPHQGKKNEATCEKDGFIKVEKKKRKSSRRNQCGTAPTGPNHLLRPAVPATLLYVSRLHYSTKAENIVEYVQVKSNFKLRVEQLQSCHNVNFNSFVVRVPTEHLSTFMKEEFWPRGVVFRRYRGRLPDTTRQATPGSRVT